jgi:hypothetical protein
MRFKEFITEAGLSGAELVKHQGIYLQNLIKKIENGSALPVVGKYQSKFGPEVNLDTDAILILKKAFYPNGDPDQVQLSVSGNIVPVEDLRNLKLPMLSDDNYFVPLGALEKTADIKGKEKDYNVGDIGEISIAIAVFAIFENQGNPINFNDFFHVIRKLDFSYSKTGGSGYAKTTGMIQWPTGKKDIIELTSSLPRRSMDYVSSEDFQNANIAEADVKGTINSAIMYANQDRKVRKGLETVRTNVETNNIKIKCDGVSDQKGTKADIIMDIDGTAVTIVSAKVGRSQLGQASGHVFDKQINFFKTVFGVDVSKYNSQWGTTLQEHDKVLQAIWDEVNPKIAAAFAGDVTVKEIPMVKQLANGLIKYSNTAEAGDVDIVKLISTPARPGYKLLRVDQRLYEALEKTDLEARMGAKGVSIYGNYNGKSILLMKARSYLSQQGNTVRTIIEGGDLLDILAEVTDEK